MPDSDLDGLTDEFERRIGTNPNDKDSDNDGLTDAAELRLRTKPTNRDSDDDGYGDGLEVAHRQNPRHADEDSRLDRNPNAPGNHEIVPSEDDPDADGMNAKDEEVWGTDPDDPDSDGDGLSDWVESIRGTDPLTHYSGGWPEDKTTDLDDVVTEDTPATPAPAPDEEETPADSEVDPGIVLTGSTGRQAFLEAARAQIGDKYRFGAETDLNDPNPTAFDSSELVEWAAAQSGVKLPDGSWRQYRHLKEGGHAVSVEDALRTPGALVFGFSSDPMASTNRPARAYVGISLGNGKVLDVSERSGEVREMDPGNFYTHAAVIPEFMEDLDGGGTTAEQPPAETETPPAETETPTAETETPTDETPTADETETPSDTEAPIGTDQPTADAEQTPPAETPPTDAGIPAAAGVPEVPTAPMTPEVPAEQPPAAEVPATPAEPAPTPTPTPTFEDIQVPSTADVGSTEIAMCEDPYEAPAPIEDSSSGLWEDEYSDDASYV